MHKGFSSLRLAFKVGPLPVNGTKLKILIVSIQINVQENERREKSLIESLLNLYHIFQQYRKC